MAFERVRTTISVARRHSNVRRVLDFISQHHLVRATDLESVLEMSESGTRKYIKDLRAAKILVIDHVSPGGHNSQPTAWFRLCNDRQRILDFRDSLIDEGVEIKPSPLTIRRRAEKTEKPDPFQGRNVHIMKHDDSYSLKPMPLKPPAHDPLFAAFFNIKQTDNENNT